MQCFKEIISIHKNRNYLNGSKNKDKSASCLSGDSASQFVCTPQHAKSLLCFKSILDRSSVAFQKLTDKNSSSIMQVECNLQAENRPMYLCAMYLVHSFHLLNTPFTTEQQGSCRYIQQDKNQFQKLDSKPIRTTLVH